jgi:predicted MPP superfamily phosphohydrolase
MNPTQHDLPDFRARPLHRALVLSDLIARIPPLYLTPAWLALAGLAGWPWGAKAGLALAAASTTLSFTIADGISLALLPRMGRSYGSITPPLLGLAVVRTILTATAGLLGATQAGLLLVAAVHLIVFAITVYATWIEPSRVGVTQEDLRSPKMNGPAPLRLLHLTDLHVERITPRERQVLHLAEQLAPDVILLTGDYLNLSSVYDAHAHAEARELLARLCESVQCPVYAVTGSPPVDRADVVPEVFAGLPITWLLDETEQVDINGHTLLIAGVSCTRERHLDAPRLRRLLTSQSRQAFTLLLYHSPDLMPEAVELGVDLYLCGHTHGGQIRLPLFGALITSSDFRKRYEMGRYGEGSTTLYVSRGLGMEGKGAPRARFLAPPEMVLWTLSA